MGKISINRDLHQLETLTVKSNKQNNNRNQKNEACMLTKTKIDWTEKTWNPVTGCTKISPGCLHCYAERMAFRCK
ncbi:MAG: DUF5131 family protein, partial [Bacteroides graminisolvens]|nr:DUF5131 family protein [Bacteroides graminisolvens]